MTRTGKVLFISYDGMTDPLGQSQVIAYMEGLSARGYEIHIISHEKPDVSLSTVDIVKERMTKAGISWHPLKYHKRPPIISTVYNLWLSWRLGIHLHRKHRFDIVHCRMILTTFLGLTLKRRYGVKFIFDMRGWWVDEKLESGLWNSPIFLPVYKYLKSVEHKAFTKADIVVSLTEAGKKEIVNLYGNLNDSIRVVPTCVNFNFFPPYQEKEREKIRLELGIDTSEKVLVYSGSLGANYNPDTLINIFKNLHNTDPSWKLLLVSNTDPNLIYTVADKYALPAHKIIVKGVEYKDVSRHLMAGDAGLIFYKHAYSVIGRCPTKMGEYLAMGLPILAIKGIGDLDYLINRFPESGCLIEDIDNADYSKIAKELVACSTDKQKLRTYAVDYFDIAKGISSYAETYHHLMKS